MMILTKEGENMHQKAKSSKPADFYKQISGNMRRFRFCCVLQFDVNERTEFLFLHTEDRPINLDEMEFLA